MPDTLKTDYVDDALDTTVNESRVYDIVDAQGNVVASNVHLEERTVYTRNGDKYGAVQINEQNTFINGLKTSFSQALTDLKATAIAQAVGAAASDTFAQVITKLGAIVNRGKVTKTLGLGQSYTIPQGYHNGQGTVSVSVTSQEKTVTASRSQQVVTPDSGKVLSKVTVNKFPDATGTYGTITSNGTHDMSTGNNYRYVSVNVPPHTGNYGYVQADGNVKSTLRVSVTSGGIYAFTRYVYGEADYDPYWNGGISGGSILYNTGRKSLNGQSFQTVIIQATGNELAWIGGTDGSRYTKIWAIRVA